MNKKNESKAFLFLLTLIIGLFIFIVSEEYTEARWKNKELDNYKIIKKSEAYRAGRNGRNYYNILILEKENPKNRKDSIYSLVIDFRLEKNHQKFKEFEVLKIVSFNDDLFEKGLNSRKCILAMYKDGVALKKGLNYQRECKRLYKGDFTNMRLPSN